jgi:hypothetical protein
MSGLLTRSNPKSALRATRSPRGDLFYNHANGRFQTIGLTRLQPEAVTRA